MINIADSGIIEESIVDGEGVRLVVFTQGCSHHCKGCQNPLTWEFNDKNKISDTEILDMIHSNPLLEGITLSGGDPFFQAKDCIKLCKAVKKEDLTVWVYTGFIFDEFIKFKNNIECDDRINKDMLNLLKYVDVVVDGPFIIEQRTLDSKYRGSTNQRLIDVKKSLHQNKIVEYKLNC